MKYKAVIFDLFGTLVEVPSRREQESVLTRIASALSVTSDDFIRLWSDTSSQRARGVFQNPEANIEYICRTLGMNVEDRRIKLVAEMRFSYTKRLMIPRAGAIELLSHLRSEGYKTGLISDSSPEVPIIWNQTRFAQLIDVAIFSCLVGLQKPDPLIYQLSAKQLAVETKNCLYIGDGNNRELDGASRAGMHPILIRVSAEDTPDALRVNRDQFDGPIIASLIEVLKLVR